MYYIHRLAYLFNIASPNNIINSELDSDELLTGAQCGELTALANYKLGFTDNDNLSWNVQFSQFIKSIIGSYFKDLNYTYAGYFYSTATMIDFGLYAQAIDDINRMEALDELAEIKTKVVNILKISDSYTYNCDNYYIACRDLDDSYKKVCYDLFISDIQNDLYNTKTATDIRKEVMGDDYDNIEIDEDTVL